MDTTKENLYSRQIGTLGTSTMLKLSNLNVAVYSLDNVGLELCKCLCLLGIKKLYIYDPREISKKTLGANYIINNIPNSSKPVRIDTYCSNYLKELNNYVEIKIMPVLDKYTLFANEQAFLVLLVLLVDTARPAHAQALLPCHACLGWRRTVRSSRRV